MLRTSLLDQIIIILNNMVTKREYYSIYIYISSRKNLWYMCFSQNTDVISLLTTYFGVSKTDRIFIESYSEKSYTYVHVRHTYIVGYKMLSYRLTPG